MRKQFDAQIHLHFSVPAIPINMLFIVIKNHFVDHFMFSSVAIAQQLCNLYTWLVKVRYNLTQILVASSHRNIWTFQPVKCIFKSMFVCTYICTYIYVCMLKEFLHKVLTNFIFMRAAFIVWNSRVLNLLTLTSCIRLIYRYIYILTYVHRMCVWVHEIMHFSLRLK